MDSSSQASTDVASFPRLGQVSSLLLATSQLASLASTATLKPQTSKVFDYKPQADDSPDLRATPTEDSLAFVTSENTSFGFELADLRSFNHSFTWSKASSASIANPPLPTSLYNNTTFSEDFDVFSHTNATDLVEWSHLCDLILSWKGFCLISVFLIFIIITIIGNTLVILAVITTRRLKTVTNCFVMSLAVADLLVGIFVMPPAVAVHLIE